MISVGGFFSVNINVGPQLGPRFTCWPTVSLSLTRLTSRIEPVPGLRGVPERRARGEGAGEDGRSRAAAGRAEVGGVGAQAEGAAGGL